jgi:hypothetical protein
LNYIEIDGERVWLFVAKKTKNARGRRRNEGGEEES